MKKLTLLLSLFLLSIGLFAQVWLQNVPEESRFDANQNFYAHQKAFNDYWQGKKYERSNGIKPFKRWENFMEPRVYPSGKLPVTQLFNEFVKRENQRDKNVKSSGNWTHLGPFDVPAGINDDVLRGVGRINAIAFHPSNENIIYVGAPAGGFWKTTDGGENWYTTTDDLPIIGISDIEVHPTNPDRIFIATGDADGSDTYSIGLLESTDAGETWNTTGLSYIIDNGVKIRGIIINPNNTDEMLVATSQGIYKSTNGAVDWTEIINTGNAGFVDLEYKPEDFSVIYASTKGYETGGVYRSTDGGDSFVLIEDNLPNYDYRRIELAVTPANPEVVYALFCNTSSALRGIYKSENSGVNWTEVTSGDEINLLGWASNGSDNGGQGYYDLSLAVSPDSEDEIWVGGVNVWKSLNGGTDWILNAHWDAGTDAEYVHADQHIFKFNPDGVLFAGNDGGIYKTTDGTYWENISHGIEILQVYRIGTSATDENILVTGAQDNGSYKCNNGFWQGIKGGDGMECLIDYTNPDIIYATSQFGNLGRSNDGGENFVNISPASNGAWITPYVIHPTNPNTLFAAYSQVYKTTDYGDSWTAISTSLAGENFRTIAVAPSNPDYIYVATYSQIFMSSNGGTDWTEITTGLPYLSIKYITISDTNPEVLWLAFSGYSDGEKVFTSSNAGSTWTNYSTGLPNIPANCIVYQNETNDLLYVGTDLGVYYRDNTMPDWTEFNTGLPNVIVDELEIHYGTNRIRAATYGRGVWESHLYDDGSNQPFASFSVNTTVACGEETIYFSDASAYSPTSWEWTFTPSTVTYVGGTDQNSQNQEIQFNAAGIYTVSLLATNDNGSHSVEKTDYIVQASIITDFSASKTLAYPDGAVYLYDHTQCEPTAWLWEITPSTFTFVDGTDANSQNPVVEFSQIGDYTVSLIATNSLDTEINTKADYISVGNNYYLEDAEITTCEGYFYDSQGPDVNYHNFENFIITFYPEDTEKTLQFDFSEFNVEYHETCVYDYLEIYDGTSVEANLIGTYCGTNSPNIVTANNVDGALTFKFHADGGVTEPGWLAAISCEIVSVPSVYKSDILVDIYPNPTSGVFDININGAENNDILINIYQIDGKLIFSEKHSDIKNIFNSKINISEQLNGVYLLEIVTANQVFNKNIIINK